MSLSRRALLGGLAASIAAACLPKVKIEQPPRVVASTVRWEQLIYGAPLIYLPRKWLYVVEMEWVEDSI